MSGSHDRSQVNSRTVVIGSIHNVPKTQTAVTVGVRPRQQVVSFADNGHELNSQWTKRRLAVTAGVRAKHSRADTGSGSGRL